MTLPLRANPGVAPLPCTYELDHKTGEANGSAHPYCSSKCQREGLYLVPEPRSVEPDGGEEIGDMETCCEGPRCGNYLHKEGRP